MFREINIHHSHVAGNIIGYAYNFCNDKVKENYKQTISVFARNLFRFDFFLCVERLENVCVEDLNMGGKGIRNLSYTNIGDQVKFIDTIKFYQEPLHALATSIEAIKQQNIKRSITVFLETHHRFSFKYSALTFENKKWVIDCLVVRG